MKLSKQIFHLVLSKIPKNKHKSNFWRLKSNAVTGWHFLCRHTHHEAFQTQWGPEQRWDQTCGRVYWFHGSWQLELWSSKSVPQTAQTPGIYRSWWGDRCTGSSFLCQPHIWDFEKETKGGEIERGKLAWVIQPLVVAHF